MDNYIQIQVLKYLAKGPYFQIAEFYDRNKFTIQKTL